MSWLFKGGRTFPSLFSVYAKPQPNTVETIAETQRRLFDYVYNPLQVRAATKDIKRYNPSYITQYVFPLCF